MGSERIFCTVKGGFTEITIEGKGVIEYLTLPSPCRDCKKRSRQDADAKMEALSNEYLVDINPTGSLNVIVAPHEDNPAVPNGVRVGDPIVLSCSYNFEN